MACNSQTNIALKEFLKEKSAGHVTLHEMPFLVGSPIVYHAMCTVCCYSVQWSFNAQEPFGVELSLVEGFSKAHLHGEEITASQIKENVAKIEDKNKNPILMVTDVGNDTFNLLGELKTELYTDRKVVAISSTAIKIVAKKSDFNVDVQSRGIFYRGYCNQCGDEFPMSRAEILQLDREFMSDEFAAFLTKHKHDGSDRELPKGRKFRHASQQG